MAPEDFAGHVDWSGGLTELKLNASARQQTPVSLNQRPTGRKVHNMRRATQAQARAGHSTAANRGDPRGGTPLLRHWVRHFWLSKSNSKTRVRPVAPNTRTAN